MSVVDACKLSFVACLLTFCDSSQLTAQQANDEPYVVVLGIAQDAGYPQAGCDSECCRPAWQDWQLRRFASCIALVDPKTQKRFLFDCTPDFKDQLRLLDRLSPSPAGHFGKIDGIFLTHAHIGHYAGLIHLGREVMGAKEMPVFAMPRMAAFLSTNGPWSQLVSLKQVNVKRIAAAEPVVLSDNLSVVPFLVPHRDEFSETVGFHIHHGQRSLVYLPDIDQWQRWSIPVEQIIASCDIALLDGTFYSSGELPGRDMSQIPHPLIASSIGRFSQLPAKQRKKIRFIHLNHSNPALRADSQERKSVETAGMQIAEQSERISLAD